MNSPRLADVQSMDGRTQLETLSDEWLMQAYIEGNETCFGLLVERYERELFSYLRRLMTDPMLAEDVFQNTFLQVHLKRHLYEIGRAFRPWLYKIATHQAIDALRRNRRHRQASLDTEHEHRSAGVSGSLLEMIEGSSPDPHQVASHAERRKLVRSTVDRLTEHLRIVVVLSYYQGMKYKEIADILQIPVGTVKSRLHAAIQRLGEQWRTLGLTRDV